MYIIYMCAHVCTLALIFECIFFCLSCAGNLTWLFVFVVVVKMFDSGSTWSAIMNGVTELPLEHAMAQWPCMTSGLENVR